MKHDLQILLPKFIVEAGTPSSQSQAHTKCKFSFGNIDIIEQNYQPAPFYHENDKCMIIVLGTPVLASKIAIKKVAEKLSDHWQDHHFLSSIDSEFLFVVIDKVNETINIISSRFSSPPFFYYWKGGTFIGSFSFNDLWLRLKELGKLELSTHSFYELLAFKRIFGHKTHDRHTFLMEPASILSFNGNSVDSKRYWLPNFKQKSNANLKDSAAELGQLIQSSILSKTSDGIRPVLFLSGGMDTRCLASSFEKTGILPLCVTINQFENREVQVAKMVAEAVGAKHRFLPFYENHYSQVFDEAVDIVGGMQLPFCMFLGFKDKIDDAADVIFHGHGFDYMFQGMYLPKKRHHFMGKLTHFTTLRTPVEPLEEFFLKNVSYGIMNNDPGFAGIIKQEQQDSLYDQTLSEVKKVGKLAREICSSPFDIVEYFTFYNFARHYPFGDHWGMNTNLPQRTLSFDNDIYDFYQAQTPEKRFDARLPRTLLKQLNPELANIISANTQYPICSSNIQKTWLQTKAYALKAIGLGKKINPNEDFERMGIPTNYILTDDLRPYTEAVLSSEVFEALDFIDIDGVRKYVQEFLDGNYKNVNGQLMMALITVDQMLKKIS